jgi:hypothetical protein
MFKQRPELWRALPDNVMHIDVADLSWPVVASICGRDQHAKQQHRRYKNILLSAIPPKTEFVDFPVGVDFGWSLRHSPLAERLSPSCWIAPSSASSP